MTGGNIDNLSRRQRECLALVYERKTSKEIGLLLGIDPGTVDGYLKEAVRHLGARGRRDAAEYYVAALGSAAQPAPVQSPGVQSSGVDLPPPAPPVLPLGQPQFRVGLPIRGKGARGNELRIGERLGWIAALAISAAIGFGMLAVGLDVLSRLLSAVAR